MVRKTGDKSSIPKQPSGENRPDLKSLTNRVGKVSTAIRDTTDWIIEEKGWHYNTKLFDPSKDTPKWELEAESFEDEGHIVWRPDENDPNYDAPIDESDFLPEEPEVEEHASEDITPKENTPPKNGTSARSISRLAHTFFLYMIN